MIETTFRRFLRFNVVGVLGVVVQLAALTIFNRATPAHYLLTSSLAVEVAVLHNFVWHLHYTWPETPSRLAVLVRFHLSSGLVSLAGNITLMRLFVHRFHIPIILANALAIACCGAANFLLAHYWVFGLPRESGRDQRTTGNFELTVQG